MAVPNPERELQRLRRAVSGGPPPAVVISGAADFFRGEAMDTIVAALPEGGDVRAVDGNQDTDGAELLDLRGGGLFGGGNWLVVRRGDGWIKKHGDELLGMLPPAAGCGLVLEVTKLDKRTKKAKALLPLVEVFEFRELYAEPYDRSRSPLEAELVGWVGQRSKAMGVALTAEAAFLIVTTVGKQPAEIVAELQRLAGSLASGERRGPLTVEDLRGKLHSSFESTPFELAEAVLGGDRRRAERSLHAMFARGVRGRDGSVSDRYGVFPFATSWLFQSMGQCLEGRRHFDDGVPLRDVAQRAGVRAFGDRFAAQVRRCTQAHLRRGLVDLLEAQRDLRRTGEDPEWILRQFVTRWFAHPGARAAAKEGAQP